MPASFSVLFLPLFILFHFCSGQYVQQPTYQQPTYQQPTYQQPTYQQPYQTQNYQQPYTTTNQGYCPTGWTTDGSCTFSSCFQTSQLCQTTNKVCCKMDPNAAVQAYQRNPKTGQCALTYCPAGAYNDGSCSTTSICFDTSESCIRGECCQKSYLPGYSTPGNNANTQPCTTNAYGTTPYNTGTTNNLVQPTTYNNGQPQIIGYTANGQPVYNTNPLGYNNGQTYPQNTYTYPTNTYPTNNYPYTTNAVQQPYYGNTNAAYPYNTGTNAAYPYTGTTNTGTAYNPYNTANTGTAYNPYNTATTNSQQIDPTLLAQACQQGDQSTCSTAIQQQGCGSTIQMSCPVQCGLCSQTTAYGRK